MTVGEMAIAGSRYQEDEGNGGDTGRQKAYP